MHTQLFFMPLFGTVLFKTLQSTALQDYALETYQSQNNIPENFQLYFFLVVTISFIVILYYKTTHKVHTEKLLKENHYFHALSSLSQETLFKFNRKTREVSFVNDDISLRTYHLYLEQQIKEHLRNDQTEGVEIISNQSMEDTFFYKLYYTSSDLESDYIIGKIVDVKEQIELQEELLERAIVDGLTGLYNASYTKETIDQLITHKDPTRKDALMLIDLDNFKRVNDTLGHLTGDYVLKDVSKALNTVFDTASLIGRIGGDEFLLYIEDVESEEVYKQNIETFSTQLAALDYPINIEASVGICIVEGNLRYEEAFVNADLSLYDIKKFNNISKSD